MRGRARTTAIGVTGYLALNEVGGESMNDFHDALANVWLEWSLCTAYRRHHDDDDD